MEIICNNCGAVIPKPDLKTIRDVEIAHVGACQCVQEGRFR
jgi:hypothetical protein